MIVSMSRPPLLRHCVVVYSVLVKFDLSLFACVLSALNTACDKVPTNQHKSQSVGTKLNYRSYYASAQYVQV